VGNVEGSIDGLSLGDDVRLLLGELLGILEGLSLGDEVGD
jgi:hypothetical protein